MVSTEKYKELYEEYKKSQALIRALQDKELALVNNDLAALSEANELIHGLRGTLKSEDAIASFEII